MNYTLFFAGGLLFNCLCGACIGGIVAVILRKRMRARSVIILIATICALVVGASLAIIYKTHGEGFSGYSAGLIIYPFLNRLTLGILRLFFPSLNFDVALVTLLDAGLMTLSGISTWKVITKRQNKNIVNTPSDRKL